MEITYGHQVTGGDDKFIGIAQRAAEETVTAGRCVNETYVDGVRYILMDVHSPGSMLVDFFPISRLLSGPCKNHIDTHSEQ